MINSLIKTSKADVYITDDHHICVRINEDEDLDVGDIKRIHEAKKILTNGSMYALLFCSAFYGSYTSEARKFAASEEVNKNAIAKAIVAKSLPMRLTAAFFINFNRPSVPTKLFTNEEEAILWLNEKIKNQKVNFKVAG
jgi:hypothetical protein